MSSSYPARGALPSQAASAATQPNGSCYLAAASADGWRGAQLSNRVTGISRGEGGRAQSEGETGRERPTR
eukprot:5284077-Pleurochrysis_carterae.AAC.5